MKKPEDGNELPTGWAWKTIGSVAEVNPPRPKYEGFSDDESATFIPMAAVDDESGTVVSPEERTLGSIRRKSYLTFTSGDVLFAKITPCMENGKSAIVPPISSGLGFGSTEFHVLRPSPAVLPEYLWRFVRQKSYRQAAEENMSGSVGQMRVPAAYVKDSVLPLPPTIDEQRAIMHLVDAIEERHTRATAHLRVARRAVRRFRQSVLAAACSGRLTPDWREVHADTQSVERALTELGGNKRRRTSDDDLSDLALPEVPESYVISTISRASIMLQYGTSKRAEAINAGVPVLRMGNIQDGRLELDELKYTPMDHEIERLMLEEGDLLFNRTNSPELVGKSAVFHELKPMTFASYLIRLRFTPGVVEPDFVNYWINSAWGKAWARHVKTDGVSQSNINGTKLGAMPLPLPPIAEQREIVHRASRMLDLADGLLARIDAASRGVEHGSQSVLVKAFRGGLMQAGPV